VAVRPFIARYRKARRHGRTRAEAVCYSIRWAGAPPGGLQIHVHDVQRGRYRP
jgi:hypothetical protein